MKIYRDVLEVVTAMPQTLDTENNIIEYLTKEAERKRYINITRTKINLIPDFTKEKIKLFESYHNLNIKQLLNENMIPIVNIIYNYNKKIDSLLVNLKNEFNRSAKTHEQLQEYERLKNFLENKKLFFNFHKNKPRK